MINKNTIASLLVIILLLLPACEDISDDETGLNNIYETSVIVGKLSDITFKHSLPIESAESAISYFTSLYQVKQNYANIERNNNVNSWFISSFKQKNDKGTWWKVKYRPSIMNTESPPFCVISFDINGNIVMQDQQQFNGCFNMN